MLNQFKDKKVIITGHTGFKGSWLTLWLHKLGAQVTGIALDPITPNDAYFALNVSPLCEDLRCNVLNINEIVNIFQSTQPEIVFHLAAQALILESIKDPLYTYNTNVIGTANILEACRRTKSVKTIVVITTDKCYENKGWIYGYRENDHLGGKDPYSSSKACAELVIAAYRESFFNYGDSPSIASARAGNVIGGGDWAENRILPDCIEALKENKSIKVRNSDTIRPWQHVLEPLSGYLLLASKMLLNKSDFNEPWNFGPDYAGLKSVTDLVNEVIKYWGKGQWEKTDDNRKNLEAGLLVLDISKSKNKLNWYPRLSFEDSVRMTVDWYKAQINSEDMFNYSLKQIEIYENLVKETRID